MAVMRRIIGGVIILVGLAGLAAGAYGVVWVQGAAETTEKEITSGMDFGLEALETISDTLQVLILTVDDTAQVLESAVESSEATVETLDAIRPAVEELSNIIALGLPDSIEAVQAAMPAVEQASSAIDATLRTLAAFEWSATIPIIDYEMGFGLGVEYDPTTPLDASVAQVSAALAELPSHLTGIEEDLETTHDSLGQTATSIENAAENLATVSLGLQATSASLAEYNVLIDRATDRLRQMRWNVRDNIRLARIALSLALGWFALSQLAPLYLGGTLLLSPRREQLDR